MNKNGLLLLLAVLPVLLILYFVYKKDKTKEPMWLLLSFFSKGILSCFLVLTVSGLLSAFLPFMNKDTSDMLFVEVLVYSFLCVALVEEVCKWLMVYNGGYNHKEFDEAYDILVYSIFVSLGFAFFENILYVINSQSLYIAILRAVSAIPGHACDAVFMGYYLSLAKQAKILNKPGKEKEFLKMSIIIPAVLHGIYDFCLMSGYVIFVIVFLIFVIWLYIISINKLNKVAKSNKNLNVFQRRPVPIQNPNQSIDMQPQVITHGIFCGGCGEKLYGPYCTKCGRKNY